MKVMDEVVLVLLLEDEEARHADHQERIHADNRPRHRAELSSLAEARRRHGACPKLRGCFAAGYDKLIILRRLAGSDACRGSASWRVPLGDFAILAPRIRHAVVGEDFALPAELHGVRLGRAVQRTVDPPLLPEPADEQDMLVSARQKRRADCCDVFWEER